MTAISLLFSACFIVCTAGALTTVLARNPVRGAMGLLSTIAGIAGLFLCLSAEFLAAIQLIVYAGAVVVLFVFVMMLLGPAAARAPERTGHAKIYRTLSGGLLVVSGIVVLAALAGTGTGPTAFQPVAAEHGSVEAVGNLMFNKAIVPFELTTALLIVAVVGAIGVARGKQGQKHPRTPVADPSKLFAGPLHPRDAERPLPKGAAQ